VHGTLALALAMLSLAAFAEPAARIPGVVPTGITLQSIKTSSSFPEAIEEKVLQYACAEDEKAISFYFSMEGILFQNRLLRRMGGKTCHILYHPSVAGFRAHAESDPVDGLMFTFESRGFLGQNNPGLGDNLDMAKAIFGAAPRPLSVEVRTRFEVSPLARSAAVGYHFPDPRHRIQLANNPASRENTWAQDYVKSGSTGDKQISLITRRSFEGEAANGARFAPLLDAIESSRAVRSKLSWDGGDLLFIRNPRDTSKLIVIYGDVAKEYWGKHVSAAEYEYVLMTEFGADAALHAGAIAGHVDYAVNFLPDGKTALLAKPETGNFELSDAAISLLIKEHGELVPLRHLRSLHADHQRLRLQADRKNEALQLLAQMAEEYQKWPRALDVETLNRARAYANQYCPDNFEECTSSAGLDALLRRDPALARAWVTAAASIWMGEVVPKALIGIVASQLAEPNPGVVSRLAALREKLEGLGFRVVESPLIAGNPESLVQWAGISYTNFLALEDRVFMPRFGLGAAENEMFARIQQQLPKPYQIVPVYARYALASNGGVHCISGVVRRQVGLGKASDSPAGNISRIREPGTETRESPGTSSSPMPLPWRRESSGEMPGRF